MEKSFCQFKMFLIGESSDAEDTKKYKVVITFEEDGSSMSVKTKVDGVKSPMPPRLRYWIAAECVHELFHRATEKGSSARD